MNGNMKSHADQMVELVIRNVRDVYVSLASHSTTIRPKDQLRDERYLMERTAAEGLSFLTTQLPLLGEFADRLVRFENPPCPPGFASGSEGWPHFLRPAWEYLSQGVRESSDHRLYRQVRTLCYCLKKLEVPTTESQIVAAMENWRLIERELDELFIYPTDTIIRAQLLLDEVFANQILECIRPHHGPGAVAGGERFEQKWDFSQIAQDVHGVWDLWETLFPLQSADGRYPGSVFPRQKWEAWQRHLMGEIVYVPHYTSRMLFVPKDSRGPRTISCEPKELMYLQQGVLESLNRLISKSVLTRGHVLTNDQTVNARIAQVSSETREYATIDLSDASDRVSCQLVQCLFPRHISHKLMGTRSANTLLPTGESVQLQKFAPMGSAICFPIESLVFWSIASAVWQRHYSHGIPDVYVFGDDIVVPDAIASEVMDALEEVGLKVNRQKSFHGISFFRESCGTDALHGYTVTPYKVKKLPPSRPYHVEAIMAYCALAGNCWDDSPSLAHHLVSVAEEALGREIPLVPSPQAFVSVVVPPDDAWEYQDFVFRDIPVRWSIPLQCWQVKFPGPRVKTRRSGLDGYCGIQDSVITPSPEGERVYVSGTQPLQMRNQFRSVWGRWCSNAPLFPC